MICHALFPSATDISKAPGSSCSVSLVLTEDGVEGLPDTRDEHVV